MNELDSIADALGWALVHFLWQGAAVAAAFACVRLAAGERAARARYAAGCAALLVMLVAPVVTFSTISSESPAAAPAMAAPSLEGAASEIEPVGPAPSAWGLPGREWVDAALPLFVALWLAGVAALSLRFLGAWVVARRLAARHCAPAAREWQATLAGLATRVGVSRPVRLVESAIAEVPAVVGWLRPVVVVPASVFAGMDPRQIEAILAHELAHVRRHDYLVNLLQSAVETLLFYHPAVWWVSRCVREERERCCDDAAVAACGDVLTYATALAELESLRAAPAPALAATGGSLVGRVRRLLAPASAKTASPSTGVAVAVVTLASVLGSVHVSGRQTTAVPEPPPPTPTPATAPAPPFPQGPFGLAPFSAQADDELPPAPPAPPEPPMPDSPAPPAPPAPPEPPDLPEPPAQDDVMQGVMRDGRYEELDAEQRHALEEQFDITEAYVEELRAVGLSGLRVPMLVSLAVHGVTGAYVRDLRASGVEMSSASEAASLKIHGATPQLVARYAELGFARLASHQLVALLVHDATPEYIGGVRALGYTPTPNQVVALRVHGVSEKLVEEVRALGYEPALMQLVTLRIHGITPAEIRERNASEGRTLPLAMHLRAHVERQNHN